MNSWSTGSSYYIYWSYTGSPGSYISLALFDSTTSQVATITSSSYLSNGDYYWTIPSTVTTGKYRIKIASTSDTTINAFSGVFTITKIAAGITVTTPSATTSWSTGYFPNNFLGIHGHFMFLCKYQPVRQHCPGRNHWIERLFIDGILFLERSNDAFYFVKISGKNHVHERYYQ